MTHLALLFPGQGSQKIGMGKDLADNHQVARRVFEEVDDALSQKLSALMWDGGQDELTLTANAQPALMACSLAAFRVLEEEAGLELSKVVGLAGHSLGEYSAHASAGSIGLGETAKLLRVRGDAMQKAMPVGEGAMAAILGLDLAQVEEIAAAAGAEIANDNCPGQVVISGPAAAVDKACATLKAAGAKRALKLDVSAAFHSSGMAPAQEAMKAALTEAAIGETQRPVVANIDQTRVTLPGETRRTLTEQVTGRVAWQDCVEALQSDGAEVFLELGAGKVLTGLQKKIAPETSGAAFGMSKDLDAIAALIAG